MDVVRNSENNNNNKVIHLRFCGSFGGQVNMKNKEKKQFPEFPELKRLKREKSIAEIMREHDCSEEVAEKILREQDAAEVREGE